MSATTSWTEAHDRASDDAWRAWHNLGVSPFEMATHNAATPAALIEFAEKVARAIVPVTLDVIAEMDVALDPEAQERVCLAAASASVRSTVWAINQALADEIARPAPMPFVAPAAGSWIRQRTIGYHGTRAPKPDTGPRWHGSWHLFSGDWKVGDSRSHQIYGRARCGAMLELRGVSLFDGPESRNEFALANEMPGVDVCGRCQRIGIVR